MIYKFRLISDEVSNFKLEIQIDSDDTFLRLRNAILDAVGYTKDQMCSFILCDEDWQKEKEVTLADMGSDSDEDIWLMADTRLSELIEDEGQRLMFVFDYLTNRAFFMEMKELLPSKHLADPLCSRKEGIPPKQTIDINEFDAKINKAAFCPLSNYPGRFECRALFLGQGGATRPTKSGRGQNCSTTRLPAA